MNLREEIVGTRLYDVFHDEYAGTSMYENMREEAIEELMKLCKRWALEKVPGEITECHKSKRGLCMNCKGRNEVLQELRERITNE